MGKSSAKQPLSHEDVFMADILCATYLRIRAGSGFTGRVERGWDKPQTWRQTAAKIRGYSPTVVVEFMEKLVTLLDENLLPWTVAGLIGGREFVSYCEGRENERRRIYEIWRHLIDRIPNPYPLDAAEFLWRLSYAQRQMEDYSRSDERGSAAWLEVFRWPWLNIAPHWQYILGLEFQEVRDRNRDEAAAFWNCYPAIKIAALALQYPSYYFP